MKTDEKHTKKLLVEGNDDKHVVLALCQKFNIPEIFDVIDCEGIDNLYDNLLLRFKQTDIETIGVLIDADTNLNDRWLHIKNLLSKQGFNMPEKLPSSGLILSNGDIKIGVWVMPNNNTDGILEDFIAFLVPQNDELLPIVDTTLAEIENKELNKYLPIHKSKARIHAWLAYQENPGTPMGLSITKKYLTTDNKNCEQLIAWLTKLFVE